MSSPQSWNSRGREKQTMPKHNLTGSTNATMLAFPGGEVTYRVKNCVVGSNGKGEGNRLGVKRACVLPGWKGAADPITLDIYANSQRKPSAPPSARKQAGIKDEVRPGRSIIRQSARNLLRRIGTAMSERFGAGNLAFITLTLPGGSEAAIAGMARSQGYIANRLGQLFRRDFDSGSGAVWISKWEYQQRGALHVHLLAVVPRSLRGRSGAGACLEQLDKYFRTAWGRILSDASRLLGIDLFERREGGTWKQSSKKWQIKVVEPRDAARYISKYVSKKEEDKHCKCPQNKFYKMSRPWSVSRAARRLLAELTISRSWQISPQKSELNAQDVGGLFLENSHAFMVATNPFTGRIAGYNCFTEDSGNLIQKLEVVMRSYSMGKHDGPSINATSRVNNPRAKQACNQQWGSARDWAAFEELSPNAQRCVVEFIEAGCPSEWVWSRESRYIKEIGTNLWIAKTAFEKAAEQEARAMELQPTEQLRLLG